MAADVVRVVLADDSRDLRELLRLRLERDPRFVVVGEAGDGERAVALVREHQPEIAVLDLGMPVLDGAEALAQIRLHAPATRVAVLSGTGRQDLRDERVLDADLHLDKSGSLEDIVTAIRGLAVMPEPHA